MDIRIGKKIVGDGKPAFVIAEVASAHDGNVEECKKLVEAFAKTGTDAIKFQMFDCDELLVHTHQKYRTFEGIEIDEDGWKEIIKFSKKFEMELMADVFDEKSADLAEQLGIAAFKVHSTDIMNPYLLAHVAKKGKPVLLATGGSNIVEIRGAIDIVRSYGNGAIALVHGFQDYPTKAEDSHLRHLHTLGVEFGLGVGYHDHVDAENKLALTLPAVAVAMGACIIEKHITLDRTVKGYDYQSALQPAEFKEMMSNIRTVEKTLGLGADGINEMSEAEKKYRDTTRKNIVARRNIAAGTIINLNMLAFKRSDPGLSPSEADKIIGKKAKRKIKMDDVLSTEMFL